MIVYHFFYDLNYFDYLELNVTSGFWFLFARSIAFTFILLAGISLTLSYSRAKKKGSVALEKYLKRGVRIFSWGLVITLLTWVFLRKGFVIFGVLHFIGVSIIIAYPFIRYRYLNLLLGIIIIFIGIFINKITVDFYYLLWLGFIPNNLCMFDYFPILPWFGAILIGIFLGNSLYPDYRRRFNLPEPFLNSIKFFCYLGRRSLFIYLIHQPILVLFLFAYNNIMNIFYNIFY